MNCAFYKYIICIRMLQKMKNLNLYCPKVVVRYLEIYYLSYYLTCIALKCIILITALR